MEDQKEYGQTICNVFAYIHTNNSSGKIKVITLFAAGEEKGKGGSIFTVDFRAWERIAHF